MDAKNPGMKTVKETADAWGVTKRYVNLCIEGGRIPDVVKMGNMWLIPNGTQKPARKPQPSTKFTSHDLDYVLSAITSPMPRDNPDAILDTGDERLRPMYEGYLAYLRGDFELVKRCFRKTEGDDAVKLRVCAVAIAVAVSTGDYSLYQEIESYCKGMILTDIGANVTAVAELTLNTAYIGAGALTMAAGWLKDGNFSALHSQLKPEALHSRTLYLLFMKKYESVLDVAQTALAFDEPERGISSLSIHMRIMCAAACCALSRLDDAEGYLLDTMRDCLPHGFITPFSEAAPHYGGLLEQLLEREYPEYYDAVIERSKRTIPNWLDFHNRFTQDNITLILSMREYQIALLVIKRFPYAKIAKQYSISAGRLKNIVQDIYGKLGVSGRDELSKYIL